MPGPWRLRIAGYRPKATQSNPLRAMTALIARRWDGGGKSNVACRVAKIARTPRRHSFQATKIPWITIRSALLRQRGVRVRRIVDGRTHALAHKRKNQRAGPTKPVRHAGRAASRPCSSEARSRAGVLPPRPRPCRGSTAPPAGASQHGFSQCTLAISAYSEPGHFCCKLGMLIANYGTRKQLKSC